MYILHSYLFYLLLSLTATVWVGRTLFNSGRIFLVDAMDHNEALADSVNRLLIVGFYLINIGYISLALRSTERPQTIDHAVEFVSMKIGLVLMILGGMHFFNLFALAKFRKWGRALHGNGQAPAGAGAAL